MEQKILQLNRENADRRVTAQTTEQNLTKVLTALGIADVASPEQAAQNIAQATAAANSAQRELAVYKAATLAGANVAALTDSRSFMATIEALDHADADSITTAVNNAIASNPIFKTAPVSQAAPASTPTRAPSGDANPNTKSAPTSLIDALTAQYSEGK